MRSRPLCLFLCFLVLLSSIFVVPVGAASDSEVNLLNPDLSEWYSSSNTVVNSYNNGIYRVYWSGYDFAEVGNDELVVHGVKLSSALVPGHSYTTKLRFPGVSEINSALGTSFTHSQIISSLNRDDIQVVFGVGFDRGSSIYYKTNMMFTCTGTEFVSDYFGSNVAFDFTYESVITGEPYFFIGFVTDFEFTDYALVYVSEPSLVDNTTAESDSFLSRLINFLKDKFDSISSSFSSLGSAITSKLEIVKNAFNSAISSLGDSLSNALTGLGNLLLYFDWEGEYKNPFEDDNSPISLIYEHLLKLDTFIKDSANSINSAVDSITGVVTLFDDFVSEFDWLFMLVNLSLVLIVFTRFIGL